MSAAFAGVLGAGTRKRPAINKKANLFMTVPSVPAASASGNPKKPASSHHPWVQHISPAESNLSAQGPFKPDFSARPAFSPGYVLSMSRVSRLSGPDAAGRAALPG
jgi:hypothetical protein